MQKHGAPLRPLPRMVLALACSGINACFLLVSLCSLLYLLRLYHLVIE